MKVLVVDDNRDAADSLAMLVETWGHTAQIAYDGFTALEMVNISPPEAILLDIGLPGMTGYDVCRRVSESHNGNILIIAVSGYAKPEDIEQGKKAGFHHHFAKPLRVELVERLLANYKPEK